MKKLSFLGLCLLTAFAASAQNNLVKEVERTIKSGGVNYADARAQIAPALTNEESKNNAFTWYIAGKLEFACYDDLYGKKAIGQPVDGKEIGNALINGYKMYMQALPLDTVVNEKGKVKTKHSKDIVKTIAGHYGDFDNAARFLWEAQDFKGAYTAWDIYLTLPQHKAFAKELALSPDSIMGELAYNQALAAWQADCLDSALIAFDRARAFGYNKKQLYDYAISVAVQKGKNDVVYDYAAEGHKLYGKEDSKFISLVINGYIESKDYAKAQATIEEALALDPTNGELYDVMGIIYESQKNDEKAVECYKKAIELNPTFARAQYNLGRKICEKAYAVSDGAKDATQAEYLKLREEQIDPLFREAASHLEEAYKLDENQRDALRYLRNIYYNLNDEENLKRIELLQL